MTKIGRKSGVIRSRKSRSRDREFGEFMKAAEKAFQDAWEAGYRKGVAEEDRFSRKRRLGK